MPKTTQLRPLAEQDIPVILNIYREPARYLPQIVSRDEAQQLVLLAEQLRQNQQGDMHVVSHDNAVIGIAHLYDVDRTVDRTFIRIDLVDPQNSSHRRGALDVFIPAVLKDGWQCLYYAVFDSCTSAVAVDLKQLGFVHDVTLRGYHKTDPDCYTDVHWFSLLASDWQRE